MRPRERRGIVYSLATLREISEFLYQEQNEELVPIGSGFSLVIVQKESTFWYLVTCKHIVKPLLDTGENIYARFNRSDEMAVAAKPLQGNWHFHPDACVDLAVLQCPPGGGALEVIAMDADSLLTPNRSLVTGYTLKEGDGVFFSGLFEFYTGDRRNIPILRFGRVAMLTNENLPGKFGLARYHLLEIQAFPFNSGSPVFTMHPTVRGVDHSIVGVIAGFFPERQRARITETGEPVVFTHLGISSAVPAEAVAEILNSDALMRDREKGIGAGRIER
jgi:hypothetical protein